MNRRFSTLSPEERYRRKRARTRAYYRPRGSEPKPKILKALELIDSGETDPLKIAQGSGISRSHVYNIKQTLCMRGSQRTSWCQKRLDALLAKIERHKQGIPLWLIPYSRELHTLYGQAEDVLRMMKR